MECKSLRKRQHIPNILIAHNLELIISGVITFNETATGIFGLGGDKLSIVSQLSNLIHRKFSYCLPPLHSSDSNLTTKLIFGDNAAMSDAGVISTPITKKSPNTFYYHTLEGNKVGNESLTYKMPSKTNLVDSADELDQELKKVIQGKLTLDPLGFLSLCYSNIDITKLPTITVKFTGADLELPSSITFIQKGDGPVCLAFVPTNDISIFGNLSQMNFFIGYDLVKSVISFKPIDCTSATSGN
ncbi:aspartic proteinase CDR1-like [Camellia sinensis]|uniref:aspartic proteinase CDR1-like n=1 Tax=Camellia sinensis TaxID=4442 RepID=UPI001035C4AF|nr:aspartic proteinase CDR1-like [Camellia sinensis]